jgi:2,5-diketo-D-gluconate reductase B
MPLAKGRVLDDPVLKDIGTRHGASAATATLAWLLQKGMIVIPASHSRRHMATNFAATALNLSNAEMKEIDALDRGDRMIDPAKAPEWDEPP